MGLFYIKNAYENIVAASEEKLLELFPAGIPEDVLNRYHKELHLLKNSESLIDFEIHRCISAEVKRDSVVMCARGSMTGFFICYLLSANGYNPLQTYYYCPQCGHYEVVKTRLFGVDLPDIECPICGRKISADGFRVPFASVQNSFRKGLNIFYRSSFDFIISVKKILELLFPQNEILPWKWGTHYAGYAIIPEGYSINDFPDLSDNLDSGERCCDGFSWDLEDRQIKPVYLSHGEELDTLETLERYSAVDIPDNYLKKITWNKLCTNGGFTPKECRKFSLRKPETFTEMASTYTDACNTYVWQKRVWQSGQSKPFDYDEYNRLIHSDAFQKYPCSCREDIFDFLCEYGIPEEKAMEVSESVGTGKMEVLDSIHIPDELLAVVKNYRYLFPRANCFGMLSVKARIAFFSELCKDDERRKS